LVRNDGIYPCLNSLFGGDWCWWAGRRGLLRSEDRRRRRDGERCCRQGEEWTSGHALLRRERGRSRRSI